MKMRLKRILCIAIGIALPVLSARGQSQLEDAIKQLSSENVRGYLQPFIDGFGTNLNSGLMRPANITTMGFGLKFEVVGVGTLIRLTRHRFKPLPFSASAARLLPDRAVWSISSRTDSLKLR
jgi:hypothetical protein